MNEEFIMTSADVLGFIVQACLHLRGEASCLCGMHGSTLFGVVITDPTLSEWAIIQVTGKELGWNLFALRARPLGSAQPSGRGF